jgi:hypothetical protein
MSRRLVTPGREPRSTTESCASSLFSCVGRSRCRWTFQRKRHWACGRLARSGLMFTARGTISRGELPRGRCDARALRAGRWRSRPRTGDVLSPGLPPVLRADHEIRLDLVGKFSKVPIKHRTHPSRSDYDEPGSMRSGLGMGADRPGTASSRCPWEESSPAAQRPVSRRVTRTGRGPAAMPRGDGDGLNASRGCGKRAIASPSIEARATCEYDQ